MAGRDADGIPFVGMDERSFRHGRKADDFACVMTDIEGRRILEVGRGRSERGAKQPMGKALNPRQRHLVCGAAIDMSAPFEKAIREPLPCADVVFDKFHVEKRLNEGVDDTRRQENGRMLKRGDRRLAKTKYIWLKGFEHLGDEEEARRRDIMRVALQTGKAWGFKEMSGSFWKSVDKRFAQANFTFWHEQVVKSGIRPMMKVANTLKRHLYGLLAWFGRMIDNALTEGFNSTIQSLKASARGYRNFENFRTAMLFFCGKLDLRPDLVRIGSAL